MRNSLSKLSESLALRWLFGSTLIVWLLVPNLYAQKKSAAAGSQDVVEVAVRRETEDGVKILGTYYPSNERGLAPVVILIHMLGRDSRDYRAFALALQKQGYAVLTLDLRGHGRSQKVNAEIYRSCDPRQQRKLDQAKLKDEYEPPTLYWESMPSCHYLEMWRDVDALKGFLVEEHNRRRLNIKKLGLVGADFGCTVALKFAVQDWGWEAAQGQDVRAIALLSPAYNYKGISVTKDIQFLKDKIPVGIWAGKGDKLSYSASMRMARIFRLPGSRFKAFRVTALHGTNLLGKPRLRAEQDVFEFFEETLRPLTDEWEPRAVQD